MIIMINRKIYLLNFINLIMLLRRFFKRSLEAKSEESVKSKFDEREQRRQEIRIVVEKYRILLDYANVVRLAVYEFSQRRHY